MGGVLRLGTGGPVLCWVLSHVSGGAYVEGRIEDTLGHDGAVSAVYDSKE